MKSGGKLGLILGLRLGLNGLVVLWSGLVVACYTN